jgi:glycosyltransferase involved in cell wall biosynthesis
VAHLHACHNLLTAVAAKHLRRAGVPYVVQPNGTARRIERRRAAKRVFDALFERDVLTHAARVVAVTSCEQRQLDDDMHQAATSKVSVVPNPLAPMPARQLPERGAFRRRYGLGDAPVLMYLGVLSPRKQPEVLARAAAGLSRQDVQLVFAGNDMGAGRRTRDQVRRLGLDARTRFTGLLTEMLRYVALADADIVVYPSHDEVFGLVPLEALQSGTPVIVSDDSGCGEVIRAVGGGLLVPPGDPRAVAAAIETVLGDLARWRLDAARAGAEASRRFHPDVVASRLEEIYREVIAGS